MAGSHRPGFPTYSNSSWTRRGPSMLARLICRVVKHRTTVVGVTGDFVWCGRCAARFGRSRTAA